jgi:hypothetical protein
VRNLSVLVCLTTLLLPLSLFSQQQSQALTNKDVLDMLKAGLTPEIVITKIKSSTCNFDTSPAALKELKSAGVPDAVILAMVQAPVASKAAGAATPTSVAKTAHAECGLGGTEIHVLSSTSPGTLLL